MRGADPFKACISAERWCKICLRSCETIRIGKQLAIIGRTIAVVGIIALSTSTMVGCALLDEYLPNPDDGRPAATGKRSPDPLKSKAADDAGTSTQAQPELADITVPRRPAPFDPDALVGASEGQAIDLLGRPSAVNENPPAIVWEYPSENCQVSLFFYNDVATNVYKVLTFKVTPKSETAAHCFEAVRRKRG